MKLKMVVFITLSIALFMLVGCDEIRVITQILRNGTIFRTIEMPSDKREVFENVPLPIDSTWAYGEYQEISDDDTVTVQTAKREFASIDDLNRTFNCSSDNLIQLRFCADLTKKFRWFYSFWTYTETYQNHFPFRKIPVFDYVTREELQLFLQEGPDTAAAKSIEDKLEKFTEDALFEEFFQPVMDTVKRMGDTELIRELLAERKDTLRTALMDIDGELYSDMTQEIIEVSERILETRSVWKLEEIIYSTVEEVERKWDFMMSIPEEWITGVILPGKIINTNAAEIGEGGFARWEFDAELFQYIDYEMYITSRVVNVWAIGMTIVIFLLIMAGLIVSFRRAKQ